MKANGSLAPPSEKDGLEAKCPKCGYINRFSLVYEAADLRRIPETRVATY
jgi:phage FluMu protein Com